MRRCLVWRVVNRSVGYRWSPIPKPPPPGFDRLYGTHAVFNTLRAFAKGGIDQQQQRQQQRKRSEGKKTTEEEQEQRAPSELCSSTAATCVPSTKEENQQASVEAVVKPYHPHRCCVHCLYVRDFSIEASSAPSPSSSLPSHCTPLQAKDDDAEAASTSNELNDLDDDSAAMDAKQTHSEGDTGTDSSPSSPHQRRARSIPRQYSALHRISALAKWLDIPIRFVPRRELVQLCGERRNQNVVMEVASYEPTAIEDGAALLASVARRSQTLTEEHAFSSSAFCSPSSCVQSSQSAFATATSEPPSTSPVVLFLDHLIDPTNVGSVLRTAFFFGVDHVILSSDSVGCTAAVSRTSTGFMEHMNIFRCTVPTEEFLQRTRDTWTKTITTTTTTSEGHSLNSGSRHASDGPVELQLIASTALEVGAVKEGVADAAHNSNSNSDDDDGAAVPLSSVRGSRRSAPNKSVRLLLLGNEASGLAPGVVQACTHTIHVHSPRQARLRHETAMQKQKDAVVLTASQTREIGGATEHVGRPSAPLTVSQMQAATLRRARLKPQEVSLNVNTACAVLLSLLLEDGGPRFIRPIAPP